MEKHPASEQEKKKERTKVHKKDLFFFPFVMGIFDW
jgi:hypothetical protein